MFLQILISGFVLGCVYGLIALGYSLIYKSSGLMNFVQGDVLTLGAFLGYTFFSLLKLPYLVSLILTVLVAFLFGMAMEHFIIRKLLKKNVLAIYIVLATIAVQYILQNSIQGIWSTKMLSYPQIFSVASIKIAGVSVQTESVFCIFMSFLCMVGLQIFMKHTRFGTAMRASAMDAKAAQACGINTSLSTGISWGIAAGMAALAGILLGPIYGVFIMLGSTIGRKGFAGAIMGGYGNMIGAIVGGILLGLTETFVAGYEITKRGLIQVLEGRHIFSQLTVLENMETGDYLRKDRKGIKDDIQKMYKLFPRLEERKMQLGGTLSGGEQQMLAIARAMIGQPKLLLLDEPSLGLAPIIVKEIFEAIKQIREDGTTIMFVEQNSKIALNTADRGYVMQTGEIILHDTCESLMNNEQVQKAYMGVD